jgi:hypothetical protein
LTPSKEKALLPVDKQLKASGAAANHLSDTALSIFLKLVDNKYFVYIAHYCRVDRDCIPTGLNVEVG